MPYCLLGLWTLGGAVDSTWLIGKCDCITSVQMGNMLRVIGVNLFNVVNNYVILPYFD